MPDNNRHNQAKPSVRPNNVVEGTNKRYGPKGTKTVTN